MNLTVDKMSQHRRSVKGTEGNWIEMQKDTFTNWANANLKTRDMHIDDIETGFEDGVKLVNLFEIVAKRSIGRYAKNPKYPNQKLENCSLVLKAMEQDGVKLVSIDSDHIVNGNFKMILGLIWQFILRYQIGGTEEKSVKIALKKLLLIWLQHVIPEQRITNLTSDWNSGVALCNLVNVMRPGLCPEYNHLNRETPEENTAKGMRIAEDEFGIPPIISPSHMASKNVDELSMMTYLSYFTQDNGIGENWTMNLVNSWNPGHPISNFNKDWNDGTALGSLVETIAPGSIPPLHADDDVQSCKTVMKIAQEQLSVPMIITADEMANPNIPELAVMAYTVQFSKVSPVSQVVNPANSFVAFGVGLSEPQAGIVNEFFVRNSDGYPLNDLKVEIHGPAGTPIPVLFDDTDPETRVYKYNAEDPGNYKVHVTYRGKHVPRSPYTVSIKQDLNTIRVHGDGLTGGIKDTTTEFSVDVGSSSSRVEARIDGPAGSRPPANVTNNGDGTYTVRYVPQHVGTHYISITINNQHLPGGPIETQVSDPNALAVSSAQYDEDKQLYAELFERIGIAVDTRHSGVGNLTAHTVGPSDNDIPTEVESETDGNFTVSFTPREVGEYHTNVYWNNKSIQGSPFIVWVSDPNKVNTLGEGLKEARVYEDNTFEVLTENAGPGNLVSYAEHNGGQIPVNVTRRDHTYQCEFRPDEVGEYLVHVNYNHVPIKGSPFTVLVGNPREARVIVDEETTVAPERTYSLKVNLGPEAGHGSLRSIVTDPSGRVIPSQVEKVGTGGNDITFLPQQPGRYEVNIYYAGGLLSGCPYIVNVAQKVDPNRVRVTGEAISTGYVNDLCSAYVDARDAGPGHLSARLEGAQQDVVVNTQDNYDGTYSLTYSPPAAGAFTLAIKWDDEHVKGSPFRVNIENRVMPESVVVQGEGLKEGTAGQPVTFTLDGRKAGEGELSCRCRAPSGKMTYILISDNKDGTYTVDLNATEPGLHTVEVEWDSEPIPGSPFLVRIMQAPDIKKVRAYGRGLEPGILGDFEGLFQVDSKGAGPGTLKVRIHGPKSAFKVEMFRASPKERIINVRYNPTETGIYTANVFWSDEHVPGSPFEIFVAENETHLLKYRDNREQIKMQEGLANGH